MAKIDPRTRPNLYRELVERNLLRQVLFLRDLFSVSQETGFRIDLPAIQALHLNATAFLVDHPGEYRNGEAHVTYSKHLTFKDNRDDIREQMLDFIGELHRRWEHDNEFVLAAFALWKINHIHPFEDGNGRTARAVVQHILHVKRKRWLPGREMVSKLIERHHDDYVAALRHADRSDEAGTVDLKPMTLFLAQMLDMQLQSADDEPLAEA